MPHEKGSKQSERTVRTLRRGEEKAHLETLNLCYGSWGKEEEWKRRYILHPDFDITKNVVIVEEDRQWAGGGTAWVREAILGNRNKVKVYGAGDLYAHPNFRGKGVYSTAMRGLNEVAQKQGAALGFAYPSSYRLPMVALPKYGFVEILHPATKIYALNPEKLFEFLILRVKEGYLPQRYEGITLNFAVAFDSLGGKHMVDKYFEIREGQFQELSETARPENVDLRIETHINSLLKVASLFYLGKKSLYLVLLIGLVRRRIKIRLSMRFLKAFLGFK